MTVAPPAQTVWWDPPMLLVNVLDQLRLRDGDVDEDWLERCVAAAGAAVNNYLDADVTPMPTPPPADVQAALEQVTIEQYRRRDAGAGNPTDWSADMMVTRWGATDILANVRAQLAPYRQRFGIG